MAELTPVTFKDVAVCFSEDEWRLLAEWEKQLYRNVMLEIHGALISLGYAIVNTDVVFRIKKAEVPHPWGQQPQKGRENTSCGTAGYSSINPDLLLRITRQEEPCALDDQALEENKSSDDSSIGHSCVTSPIPIKLKREEEQNGMKSHDCKRTESVNNPTSTHPVVTSVFSLRVKQEEEALYPDFCGFERRKCVNSTTSTRTIIPDVPRQILQGKPDFISHHLSSGKATARNGSTSDAGYPLKSWLLTPVRNPQNRHEEEYNCAHTRTRIVIEQTFGLLKSRFRCISRSGGALLYGHEKVAKITMACVMLHNMCIRWNVPLPPDVEIEEPDEDDDGDEDGGEGDAGLARGDGQEGRAVRQHLINQIF
ncbi:uncharacterized protein [Ambystoma mexicanum]|uniref:uncharacterized protein isoform X5 n=1 Tax=Ambystoma mexicanum TaxID=8296 RepID=UPI0037E73290